MFYLQFFLFGVFELTLKQPSDLKVQIDETTKVDDFVNGQWKVDATDDGTHKVEKYSETGDNLSANFKLIKLKDNGDCDYELIYIDPSQLGEIPGGARRPIERDSTKQEATVTDTSTHESFTLTGQIDKGVDPKTETNKFRKADRLSERPGANATTRSRLGRPHDR